MPTPLDRALNSRNTFLAFGGIVTAVAAWSIWGQDMFPKEGDPTGDPEKWTREELRRWLAAGLFCDSNGTNSLPSIEESRAQRAPFLSWFTISIFYKYLTHLPPGLILIPEKPSSEPQRYR